MFLLTIDGEPRPQKQTQFVRRSGIAYDPSKKDKELIQWQVRPYAPEKPLSCPVALYLNFYFTPPKSTSAIRKKQMINGVILHIKRPDIDNLAYLVTNALKGIFYDDDSQIVDLILAKKYGETAKTVVKIVPLPEAIKCG